MSGKIGFSDNERVRYTFSLWRAWPVCRFGGGGKGESLGVVRAADLAQSQGMSKLLERITVNPKQCGGRRAFAA